MYKSAAVLVLSVMLLLVIGCDTADPDDPPVGPTEDSYTGFPGMVFDISATPGGTILVAVTDADLSGNTIQEISAAGIDDVGGLPVTGSGLNGLAPLDQETFFATTGGLDLTVGAGLWRVSQGSGQLVADIAAYVMGDWDPNRPFDENDLADAGPYPEQWKDFRCETFAQFSHGPQTNPYQIAALSGSDALIADAANNGLLWANTNGEIDVVTFMDPAYGPGTQEWMVLGSVAEEDGAIVAVGELVEGAVPCYVEPVPTAVAVGADGAYYVSELTGATPQNFGGQASPEGLARIWRIAPGTRNAVCPSAECSVAVSGLNAVIDVEFGPNGMLYVVEFEKSGFLAAVAPDLGIPLAGGALKRCDVFSGACEMVEDGLTLPGAITFDQANNLWLVENVFEPTVRRVALR